MLTQIDNLLKQRNELCLSVLIPLNKYAALKPVNAGTIKRACKKAKKYVEFSAASSEEVEYILEQLGPVEDSLLQAKPSQSIGIFLSKSCNEVFQFPFKTKEKIVVDRTFEIRDLLYYRQFLMPYFVASVAKTAIHLYHFHYGISEEVNDHHLPMMFEDDYEYARPVLGSSYSTVRKNFERDKSQLVKTRLDSFFKNAVDVLKNIPRENEPFLLTGTREMVNRFKDAAQEHLSLAGIVEGSFKFPFSETTIYKFRCEIEKFRKKQIQLLFSQSSEGRKGVHVIEGVEAIWNALPLVEPSTKLFVENGFEKIAYKNREGKIFLKPPPAHSSVIKDIVDDIIESVYHRHGQIVFVDNDRLDRSHRITMVVYDS